MMIEYVFWVFSSSLFFFHYRFGVLMNGHTNQQQWHCHLRCYHQFKKLQQLQDYHTDVFATNNGLELLHVVLIVFLDTMGLLVILCVLEEQQIHVLDVDNVLKDQQEQENVYAIVV